MRKNSSVHTHNKSKTSIVKGRSASKRTSKKRKTGRPKYIVSKADKKAVYELAKKGCSEVEIAKVLRISPKTLQINKRHFLPSIKKGRREGDPKNIKDVENALLKICKGYGYDEVHIETRDTPDGITDVKRTVTKQVCPNVAAIVFYLCNRASEKWKNTQKIQHEGVEDKPIQIVVNGVNLSKYPEATKESKTK